MSFLKGPPAIKSEQARPNAWVYVDIEDVDVGTYVERARQAVAAQVEIPTGYSLGWSGQYEYMVRAEERMQLVVPITLLLIFLTIYASTRSVARTLIVLSTVPLSLIGTFWLLYVLGYNLSIAVWVGIIALAGLSAETGVVMLLYLDRACEARPRRRAIDDARRAPRSSVRRRGAPRPAGGDAERHHRVGTLAHHVEYRHRRRRDEADRGADGRRGGDDRRRRAAGVSGRLLHLAGWGLSRSSSDIIPTNHLPRS